MHHRSGVSICQFLYRSYLRISPTSTSPNFLNSFSYVPSRLGPDLVFFCSKSSFVATPFSSPRIFPYPHGSNAETHIGMGQTRREFSTESGGDSMGDIDVNKEVDKVNLKFVEAREEIEMAMESKETVYFDEEAECARAAVKQVVDMFQGLLGKLPESEKAAVQRSMGLKIEQLKAELQQLND